MTKIDQYTTALQNAPDWDAYLLQHSGLPGPRANLELLHAAAGLIDEQRILVYCAIPRDQAPGDSPLVFLFCCGIVGLGRLVAQGQTYRFQTLRAFASDDRWRVREAVAMALQRVGAADIELLLAEMRAWQDGNPYEQRAVAAGLCEPALLGGEPVVSQVLHILDNITASFCRIQDRKSGGFTVLKKGLSYAWSVAVAASPPAGKQYLEKWVASTDRDVRAVMKENLRKNRLTKIDPAWTAAQLLRLDR